MSMNNITSIEKIKMKGESDHFPALADIEVVNNPRMNKKIQNKIIKKKNIKQKSKLLNYLK